jgi:hypothetical protein
MAAGQLLFSIFRILRKRADGDIPNPQCLSKSTGLDPKPCFGGEGLRCSQHVVLRSETVFPHFQVKKCPVGRLVQGGANTRINRRRMVQWSNGGSSSSNGGSADPTEPTEPTEPRVRRSGGAMQSLVESVLLPFVKCVSPPLQACAPESPWRPRHGSRHGSRAASPSMPLELDPSYSYGSRERRTRPAHPAHPARNSFSPKDILCGKGRSAINHPGNESFLELVQANQHLYASLTKKQKIALAHQIVDLVHRSGGSFMKRDAESKQWYDIGLEPSVEKVSVTLVTLRKRDHETHTPARHRGRTPESGGNGGVERTPVVRIPSHLQQIYQASPLSPVMSDHRNPVESPPPPMYYHPSSASYELSPSTSRLPMRASPHPPALAAVSSRMTTGTKTPQQSFESRSFFPSRPVVSPEAPLALRAQASAFSGRGTTLPSLKTTSATSSGHAFPMPRRPPPMDWTSPVDGFHAGSRELAPPSSVRRFRYESEDGMAALSAAAFLRLDEIE